MTDKPSIPIGLIAGDAAALLAVSLVGYLSHYAGKETFSLHWVSTFIPYCVGWALIAPWLGLYLPQTSAHPSQIWRAALAAWLAAPLAAWLRGMWLNTPILPIFVLVLGPSTAVGMTLWRFIFTWTTQRKNTHG